MDSLEVGIASTSEHCKPELPIVMFYFCDAFNAVEMWQLALIWSRYNVGKYYTNYPTQDLLIDLSLNLQICQVSLIWREASSFGINFKTLLKNVSTCDETFCCVWTRCIKSRSKGQIHLWCNFGEIPTILWNLLHLDDRSSRSLNTPSIWSLCILHRLLVINWFSDTFIWSERWGSRRSFSF